MEWLTTAERLLGGWPEDYLVFDLETTGFKGGEDLILQMGWGMVQGGQLQSVGTTLLDWFSDFRVEPLWLEQRINKTRDEMHRKSPNCGWNFTRRMLEEQGGDPSQCLRSFTQLLQTCHESGWPLIGHNLIAFDVPFLRASVQPCGIALPESLNCWDTMLLEKGRQLGTPLLPGTTPPEVWKRLRHTGRQVKSSLSQHCLPKYGLDKRYALDASQAHSAGYDVRLTYYLFETFRQLAQGRAIEGLAA